MRQVITGAVSFLLLASTFDALAQDVVNLPPDPEVQAAREAEFRRLAERSYYSRAVPIEEVEAEMNKNFVEWLLKNPEEAKRMGLGTPRNPVAAFVMGGIARLVILVAFLITLVCLGRAFPQVSHSPVLSRLVSAVTAYAPWPTHRDSMVLLGSLGASYALLWNLPDAGSAAVIFFLGLVVPLGAFVLTWQLLSALDRKERIKADVFKRIAVSLTAALILLQFGFEPWRFVVVKVLVILAVTSFFLRGSALWSYRAFLVPAVFAFVFSLMRLFGPDPTTYVLTRLVLNLAIIFLTLRSFVGFTGSMVEGLFPERHQLIKACRSLIGLDNTVRSSAPPAPPNRWFLFLDGQVQGPVLEPELIHGVAAGKWSLDTPVCTEGSQEWKSLNSIVNATA